MSPSTPGFRFGAGNARVQGWAAPPTSPSRPCPASPCRPDVSDSDKYYARDIIVPPVAAHDGVVTVPTGPGLGHDVDVHWVEQNTVRFYDSGDDTAA